MFPHIVATFMAACVYVTLPFAMFATPDLDSVPLRICSVDLEDCFWSQVWALVSRGLASALPHSGDSFLLVGGYPYRSLFWALVSRGLASALPHSGCSLLPLLPLV
ncbi:hypothetical protein HID58_084615 [Brassica napus]|uniref:Secreted protein n=1 Tax=Brassica napus TaxID=3708 RepID=A0ABQ7XK78_BRANA|nr:hypothetical protein HID58_084615 [Brassica napus]